MDGYIAQPSLGPFAMMAKTLRQQFKHNLESIEQQISRCLRNDIWDEVHFSY